MKKPIIRDEPIAPVELIKNSVYIELYVDKDPSPLYQWFIPPKEFSCSPNLSFWDRTRHREKVVEFYVNSMKEHYKSDILLNHQSYKIEVVFQSRFHQDWRR